MKIIEIVREMLLPGAVLSLLPHLIRKPVESAMRESMVSGFSTVIILAALASIAADAVRIFMISKSQG